DGWARQGVGRSGRGGTRRRASGHVLRVPRRRSAHRVPGRSEARLRHLRRGRDEDDHQGSHALSRRPRAVVPLRRPDDRRRRSGGRGVLRLARRGPGRAGAGVIGVATRRDGAPLSLWHDQGPAPKQREPLVGGDEADVVIVGGGYTGLWTAYYLLEADADLRVVVIEAEFCGYGASGRNGGGASARSPGSRSAMADAHGMAAVVEYQRHMFDAVDEIGRIADKERPDCDCRKGGVLLYATTPAHVPRLHGYMQDLWHWGCEAGDLEWLDISEARRRAAVAGTRGAMFNRHCASINPWRLVAGLAEAVERRGAVIYEKSRARVIRPNMVVTDDGVVRAKTVLRCTEAFTAEL